MTKEYPLHTPQQDSSRTLIETGRNYWTENYKPRDMILDHGRGSRVWDEDGNDYVDLGSGIAVSSLGHQHPALINAMDKQMRKLWHTSNIFFTAPPIELAKELVAATNFAKRVYFCNSGAEANEAAIKIVRKWGADQGRPPEAREIITFRGSFHGRTIAAVTATAQPKYHEGFEPMPGGFIYCDRFNDLEALRSLISPKTLAIMLEPLQGEGGVTPATPEFLRGIRALCDEHNLLLIADEIQCGMGRTGTLFCHEHVTECQPDIMTLAKALGCGIPIGATLVGEKVEHTLQLGTHGSTYGGNPVMCAVALEALRIINTPEILDNVTARSEQTFTALHHINKQRNLFSDIRGKGLMIGAELTPELHGKSGELSEICRRFGVLVLVAGPNVLRLLPPLNITEEELSAGLTRMQDALTYFLENHHHAE